MATTIRSPISNDTVDSTRSAFNTLSENITSDINTVSLAEEETGRTLRGVSSLDSSTSSSAAPDLASPSQVLPSIPTITFHPLPVKADRVVCLFREHNGLSFSGPVEYQLKPVGPSAASMVSQLNPELEVDSLPWMQEWVAMIDHFYPDRHTYINDGYDEPEWCPSNQQGISHILRSKLIQIAAVEPEPMAKAIGTCASSGAKQALPRAHLRRPKPTTPIVLADLEVVETAIRDQSSRVWFPAQQVPSTPKSVCSKTSSAIDWDAPINWDDSDDEDETPASTTSEPIVVEDTPAAIAEVHVVTNTPVIDWDAPMNWDDEDEDMTRPAIESVTESSTITSEVSDTAAALPDLSVNVLDHDLTSTADESSPLPSPSSEQSDFSEHSEESCTTAASSDDLAVKIDETSPLPSPSCDPSETSEQSQQSWSPVATFHDHMYRKCMMDHWRPFIDLGPSPEPEEDFLMSPNMRRVVGRIFPEQVLAEDNNERLKLTLLPREVTSTIDLRVRNHSLRWKSLPYGPEDEYDSVSEYSDVHSEFDEEEFSLPSEVDDKIALYPASSQEHYDECDSASEYSEAQGARDRLQRDFPYDFESPITEEDLKEEIIDLSCPLAAEVEDAIDSLVYKHHFWNSVSSFGSYASFYSDSEDDEDEEPEFGPVEPLMMHPNISLGSSFTYEAGITTSRIATCSTLSLVECIFEPLETCSTTTSASLQLPSIPSVLDTFSALDCSMPYELLPESGNLPRLTLEDPEAATMEVEPVMDAKDGKRKKKSKKFNLLKKLARTCSKLTKYD